MIQTRKLSNLIGDLSHPDISKRRSAAEALSSGDERALYPLLKALTDENAGVQDAAMRSLISIGGEVVAYMVIPLLREESLLRNTAIIILRDIGQSSVPLLKSLLKDKDPDVRKFAIDIICDIRHCEYPEEISILLREDPNPNVRASAARALGMLGYRAGIPFLIEALRDEEWVVFSVLEALAMFRDDSSVPIIEGFLAGNNDTLRMAAIDALGSFGTTGAVSCLTGRLSKADGFEKIMVIKSLISGGVSLFALPAKEKEEIAVILRDMLENGDTEEKIAAVRGLADLQDTFAYEAIVDFAGSFDPSNPENDEFIFAIKDAIRSFGCTDAFISIISNASIKYRGKVIAIETVGELNCNKAVPSLVALLEKDIRDVRRATINALGNIGDEDAMMRLIDAVDDYDSHVRKSAINALGKIGDKVSFHPIMEIMKSEKYYDVIEECVKALVAIDSEEFFRQTADLDNRLKGIIERYI